MTIKIIFVCSILVIAFAVANECQRWNKSYKHYLGTKTAYRVVANTDASKLEFDSCSPIKSWMMVRHGTRYPSDKVINGGHNILLPLRDEIVKNYENGNSSLCADVVESFRKWTPEQLKMSTTKLLAHAGEDEMLNLGERMQQRLPNLFPSVYSSKYEFKSSGEQRAIESLRYFMIGVYGRNTVDSVWPLENDVVDQRVVRFYKLCPRWRKEVKKNPATLQEMNLLQKSQDYKNVLRNISARLGLERDLDAGTATLMYTLCGFETAWDEKDSSPWCSVFTQPDLALFEVVQDLKYYHIDGYGNPLNYKQACPATQHLLNHFTTDDGPTTSVSFSHSGTILKMLAFLGTYNDTDWRTTRAQNRLWRTSQIDAFASNLAFVLYRCETENKFLFLHQERAVPLPGCPEVGLCPFSVLWDKFSEGSCDFTNMCALKTNI